MATSKKTFKDFHQDYGIYLLRAPHSRLTLADLADIHKRFFLDISEESIIDEFDWSKEERIKARDYLAQIPLINADLPDISIKKENEFNMKVSIPNLKVKGGFAIDSNKILNYEFGNIQAKVLDNTNQMEIRRIIEKELEKMGSKWIRNRIGKPGRSYFVERLYYGKQVKLTLEKDFKLDANVGMDINALGDVGVDVSNATNNNQIVSFDGLQDVPFAASIISLKNL